MQDETIHAKLDGIKELIELQFKQNAEDHEALRDELREKASGWVETFVKSMIGTTLLAVLGALLALILAPIGVATAYYIVTKI